MQKGGISLWHSVFEKDAAVLWAMDVGACGPPGSLRPRGMAEPCVCVQQKDKALVLKRESPAFLLPFGMAQPPPIRWLESLNHLNIIMK